MTQEQSAPDNQGTRRPQWLAILGIVLGLLYVGGGIGYLVWSSQRAPGGRAAETPQLAWAATRTPSPEQRATLDAAATGIASLRLTATAQPTPTSTATPQPTPTMAPGLTEIVILHSNDTWGYTLPCG